MKGFSLIILLSLILSACGQEEGFVPTVPPSINGNDTRTFLMGFTPFPSDITPEAITDTNTKVKQYGDIITLHFDNGIPWDEALGNTGNSWQEIYPYHKSIMDDWSEKLKLFSEGDKKFVIVTPLNSGRNALALYKGERSDGSGEGGDNLPLNYPFDEIAKAQLLNDDAIKLAYLRYCKRVIEYFKPDYFGVGIEVNLIRKNYKYDKTDADPNNDNPSITPAIVWNNYIDLQAHVYTELKKIFPNLPVMASVESVEAIEGYGYKTDEFGTDKEYADTMKHVIDQVLQYSDYYAVSIYPYKGPFRESNYPANYLDNVFSLSTKPIVIAETGMSAETFNAYGVTFLGSEEKQNNYLNDLFYKANEYNLEFINYFLARDYDDLYQNICIDQGLCDATTIDIYKTWKDIGLFDGNGHARPALITWENFLKRDIAY